MKRRGLLTMVLVLMVLLAAAHLSPVEARTPPWGHDDYQHSNTIPTPSLGDDDDDGVNVAGRERSLLVLIISYWAWMNY